MDIGRRKFLGTVGAGVVAASGLAQANQSRRIERIGMQLFTVRNEMAKDFDGTLARVAALGFKEVEFAGYFDRTPQQVRAALDRNGIGFELARINSILPASHDIPLDAVVTEAGISIFSPRLQSLARRE